MKKRSIAAIILAGGFSSRMDRFKPLLPLGSGTIVSQVIDTFRRNDVDIILVGGYRREELFSALESSGVTFRENPNYQDGMLSSVQAGVSALDPAHRAFFVIPVDIPLVRPATVRNILEAAGNAPDRIAYPVFRGKRGHPPLIPSELAPEILGFKGSGGLKSVLALHDENAIGIPVVDSGILLDIDTPPDYDQVLHRFESCHVPTGEECDAIFEMTETPTDRIEHGRVTSQVAVTIARALVSSGQPVDVDLVGAAALLHDIAKGKSRHDETGGNILREMGFSRLADIVGIHTDLGGRPVTLPTLEARIVYLADKYVRGDKVVSLDERYQISQQQYGKDPQIGQHVQRRKQRALEVKKDIETLIGTQLEHLIFPK